MTLSDKACDAYRVSPYLERLADVEDVYPHTH